MTTNSEQEQLGGAAQDIAVIGERLRVDGLKKTFGSVVALRHADLSVRAGEVHALLGANGAGKSTLIKIVCGVYSPDSGSIRIDGEEVHMSSASDAADAGIAVVYQDPPLFSHLSVVDNMFAGHHILGAFNLVNHRAQEKKAREALRRLRIDIDERSLVGSLSVAERGFVAIARALVRDSKLLILDEPTASLTPDEAARLFDIVRSYRDDGGAVLLVSHRLDEIRSVADRITIFRDGASIAAGTIDEYPDRDIVAKMLGRELAEQVETEAQSVTAAPGEVLLKVDGLTEQRAFRRVSFELRAGQVVGLVGLVGSGRTELVETIMGLRRETAGTVTIRGVPAPRRNPRSMAKRGVVLVPEDRDHHGVVLGFSISENVALANPRPLHRGGILDRRDEDTTARDQVEALSIRMSSVRSDVGSLSGGNRQKVVVGKWLARHPSVMMLDEPTHGVDVGAKAELHAILRELAHKNGIAVLVVSSDFGEVVGLADRVLVMRSGKLTVELGGDEITEPALLLAATAQIEETTNIATITRDDPRKKEKTP